MIGPMAITRPFDHPDSRGGAFDRPRTKAGTGLWCGMPAEGIHLTALREAMASPALSTSVRRRLIRRDDAARLGALVPDLASFRRYVGEVIRYALGMPAQPSPWGTEIHDGGAVRLLGSLLTIARR